MHSQLRNDQKEFSSILELTHSIAGNYLNRSQEFAPGRYVADIPLNDLSERGIGAKAVLDLFEKHYSQKIAATSGPRYFGFVTGGSTPASVAGDWLVSAYDQNACGSNDSIAPQLERQALHFLKQLLGIDESYYGTFVTGATMSNFVSLSQARQWVGEHFGRDISSEGMGPVPINVISGTPHSSILKSLSMLGMGKNCVIKPEVLPDREAVDLEALENALKEQSTPAIVVANAGTVNTVDFDDLEGIAALKAKYRFWLHVDAAFGGFAGVSDKFRHLVRGINAADSITVDAHKWLNVPYDAAMQFTRHKNLQLKVFQNSASYLSDPARSPDLFHYTPESSRRWRSLPSWFSLMAYGKEGHREIVERNCALASYFGDAITGLRNFRLLAPVRMNVVCFTLDEPDVTSESVQKFLAGMRDDGQAFFTPTLYKGTPGIRAAISNWQTSEKDIDITIDAMNRVVLSMTERILH
jgi:glutamate/tyrosine decarboxylase-like PLP-dependent enzyme